jgi:hypothetical protein
MSQLIHSPASPSGELSRRYHRLRSSAHEENGSLVRLLGQIRERTRVMGDDRGARQAKVLTSARLPASKQGVVGLGPDLGEHLLAASLSGSRST